MTLQLYTWWRSQASFRVRIAVRLKGLEPEMIIVDLARDEQLSSGYRELNAGMVLPTLRDGEGPPLVQSLAILEYLDEQYPEPPLLPKNPRSRAHVRALAQVLAVDSHPLIVPRVRKYLAEELHVEEAARMNWLKHWLEAGFQTFEHMLSRQTRTGNFCYGEVPTIADICLVAHATSAQMLYGADLQRYPTVAEIFQTCMDLDAFIGAHPHQQPDALATA